MARRPELGQGPGPSQVDGMSSRASKYSCSHPVPGIGHWTLGVGCGRSVPLPFLRNASVFGAAPARVEADSCSPDDGRGDILPTARKKLSGEPDRNQQSIVLTI